MSTKNSFLLALSIGAVVIVVALLYAYMDIKEPPATILWTNQRTPYTLQKNGAPFASTTFGLRSDGLVVWQAAPLPDPNREAAQ